MNKIEKIYELVSQINNDKNHYLRKNYGVLNAGFGFKNTNKSSTNEISIILYVNKKKKIENLKESEIIPKYIDFEDIKILTDVSEKINCKNIADYCHPESQYSYPLSAHWKKHRPLKGGISSINSGGLPDTEKFFYIERFSDATLGIIVRDKTDGQIVLMSNHHVYGNNLTMPINYTQNHNFGTYANIGNFYDTNILNYRVKQPGTKEFSSNYERANPHNNTKTFSYYNSGSFLNSYGVGSLSAHLDQVGTTKRTVPYGDVRPFVDSQLTLGGSVDAAIASIDTYDDIDPIESNKIENWSVPGPYKFATREEIFSLFDNTSLNYQASIFKAGRTTGAIGENSITPCSTGNGVLSAESYSPTIVSNTVTPGVYYNENIIVKGDGSIHVAKGGDSGSAVFALLSSDVPAASAWKMIGLLYAGPSDLSLAAVTPIHLIQEKLDVVSWDGTIPTLSSTTETLTVLDDNIFKSLENSNCYNLNLNLSGQKYNLTGYKKGTLNDGSRYGSAKKGDVRNGVINNILSNSKGDVIAPNYNQINKHAPCPINTINFIISNNYELNYYTYLFNPGGGIYLKEDENGFLKAKNMLYTPYNNNPNPCLRGDYISYGRTFTYGDPPDFNSLSGFGEISKTITQAQFSAYGTLSTHPNFYVKSLEGGNEHYMKGQKAYVNNYLMDTLTGIDDSFTFHLGAMAGTMNDKDVFLGDNGTGDTTFAQTTGSQQYIERRVAGFHPTTKEYLFNYNIKVPDDDVTFPSFKTDILGDKTDSKIIRFSLEDDTTKYRQAIKSLFDGNGQYGYEKFKFRNKNNQIQSYSNTESLGIPGAAWTTGLINTDSLIKTYKDKLYFTTYTEYSIDTTVSGCDDQMISVYKLNESTDLYEPDYILSASMPRFDYPITAITDNGNPNPADTFSKRLGVNYNHTSVNNIEINDDYLFLSEYRTTGYKRSGSITVFENNTDTDRYTYSCVLTTPVLSATEYNNPILPAGREFGTGAKLLSNFLFVTEKNTWGQSNPEYTIFFENSVDNLKTYFPIYILDTNDNFNCVSVLSTPYTDYHPLETMNPGLSNFSYQGNVNNSGIVRRNYGAGDKIILSHSFSFLNNDKEYNGIEFYDDYPSVRYYDIIEYKNNVPTLTKRLSCTHNYIEGAVQSFWKGKDDYILESASRATVNQVSFDNKYLYVETNNLHGQDFSDLNNINSDKVFNLFESSFMRIKLDDETYFKPISAYENYSGPTSLLQGLNLPTKSTNDVPQYPIYNNWYYDSYRNDGTVGNPVSAGFAGAPGTY